MLSDCREGERKVKVKGKAQLFQLLRISQCQSYDTLCFSTSRIGFKPFTLQFFLKHEQEKLLLCGTQKDFLKDSVVLYEIILLILLQSVCLCFHIFTHVRASEKLRPTYKKIWKKDITWVYMGLLSLDCFIYSDTQTHTHTHTHTFILQSGDSWILLLV